MPNSSDPKVVALTALGLACFAFGFSVTAVAYPSVSQAASTNRAAPVEQRTAFGVTASGASTRANVIGRSRGCRLAE
jgi:hypothetical protein